jgi:hypothetical protein
MIMVCNAPEHALAEERPFVISKQEGRSNRHHAQSLSKKQKD